MKKHPSCTLITIILYLSISPITSGQNIDAIDCQNMPPTGELPANNRLNQPAPTMVSIYSFLGNTLKLSTSAEKHLICENLMGRRQIEFISGKIDLTPQGGLYYSVTAPAPPSSSSGKPLTWVMKIENDEFRDFIYYHRELEELKRSLPKEVKLDIRGTLVGVNSLRHDDPSIRMTNVEILRISTSIASGDLGHQVEALKEQYEKTRQHIIDAGKIVLTGTVICNDSPYSGSISVDISEGDRSSTTTLFPDSAGNFELKYPPAGDERPVDLIFRSDCGYSKLQVQDSTEDILITLVNPIVLAGSVRCAERQTPDLPESSIPARIVVAIGNGLQTENLELNETGNFIVEYIPKEENALSTPDEYVTFRFASACGSSEIQANNSMANMRIELARPIELSGRVSCASDPTGRLNVEEIVVEAIDATRRWPMAVPVTRTGTFNVKYQPKQATEPVDFIFRTGCGERLLSADRSLSGIHLRLTTPITLKGTITCLHTGRPLSNTPIGLRIGDGIEESKSSFTTDQNGNFAYTHRPPRNYSNTRFQFYETMCGNAEVITSDSRTVEIDLARPITLSGQVLDPNARVVAQKHLNVVVRDGDSITKRTTTTDSDGYFELQYRPIQLKDEVSFEFTSASKSQMGAAEIKTRRSVKSLRVHLQAPISIRGHLSCAGLPRPTPIANDTVVIVVTDRGQETTTSVDTNEVGAFELAFLRPAGLSPAQMVFQDDCGSREIEVRGSMETTIVLTEPIEIQGHARLLANGKPCASKKIRVDVAKGRYHEWDDSLEYRTDWITTEQSGAFTMKYWPESSGDTYSLKFTERSCGSTIRHTSKSRENLDIMLAEPISVSGQLLDLDGSAIEGSIRVQIKDGGMSTGRSLELSSQGIFFLKHLPKLSSNIRIIFYAPRGIDFSTAEITTDRSVENLRLGTHILRGTVTCEKRPYRKFAKKNLSATITASGINERSLTTDAEGTFRLTYLATDVGTPVEFEFFSERCGSHKFTTKELSHIRVFLERGQW